jgi:uncharacterized secreted protein with C-terminal beta-propeller domain
MKKAHIIIIAIVVVVLLTGIIILVQKKATGNKNENIIVTDSDSEIAVSNFFSDKINVTIGSVSGMAGSTVTVPVSFDTITESGVGCCNFSIVYDNTKVEIEEVVAGDILGSSKDNLEYSISDSKGIISILFAGKNERDAITQAGTFAYIKFNIYEDAANGDYDLAGGPDVSFGDSMLERIEYSFKDGKIIVK